MSDYQEEVPTYRRLDDPTRPLWGMSIRTLVTLGVSFVLGYAFVKSGILPTKFAITVATIVMAVPVTAVYATDGQSVNPVREIIGVFRSLASGKKGVALPEKIRGGLVVADVPVSDQADANDLPDWEESIGGAREITTDGEPTVSTTKGQR